MRKRNVHQDEFSRGLTPHMDELLGAATRLTGSCAEGEDLLQESALRAWTFWERFETGTNRRAWMHRIVFNTFVNQYRRRRREREILLEMYRGAMGEACEDGSNSGMEPSAQSMADEVQHALDSLADEYREVIIRVDVQLQSYKEVAEALGCPVGTVMSRLHRARKALRQTLRSYAAENGFVQLSEAA